MKISDLRIGNNILANRFGQYIPATITLLSDFDDFDNWKPDPLTGQSLMFLGFKKTGNTYDKDKISIWLPDDQYKKGRVYFNSCHIRKSFDFVHELQNFHHSVYGKELSL